MTATPRHPKSEFRFLPSQGQFVDSFLPWCGDIAPDSVSPQKASSGHKQIANVTQASVALSCSGSRPESHLCRLASRSERSEWNGETQAEAGLRAFVGFREHGQRGHRGQLARRVSVGLEPRFVKMGPAAQASPRQP